MFLSVYKRYTDENAKNVYEMYIFSLNGEEIMGRIKLVFIPGERYEFHYAHANGFKDYFITDSVDVTLCDTYADKSVIAHIYVGI